MPDYTYQQALIDGLREGIGKTPDTLAGALEIPLHMGTSALAQPTSGIAALISLLLGDTAEGADKMRQDTGQGLTYSPRSHTGGAVLDQLAQALAQAKKGTDKLPEWAQDHGLPAGAAAVIATGADALPQLLTDGEEGGLVNKAMAHTKQEAGPFWRVQRREKFYPRADGSVPVQTPQHIVEMLTDPDYWRSEEWSGMSPDVRPGVSAMRSESALRRYFREHNSDPSGHWLVNFDGNESEVRDFDHADGAVLTEPSKVLSVHEIPPDWHLDHSIEANQVWPPK